MGKHRDDGEMSTKSDGGALGPDEGTARNTRMEEISNPTGVGSHDGGGLGPDQGTARADPQPGAHAEFGGGKHEHSPHMPGQKDQPNC